MRETEDAMRMPCAEDAFGKLVEHPESSCTIYDTEGWESRALHSPGMDVFARKAMQQFELGREKSREAFSLCGGVMESSSLSSDAEAAMRSGDYLGAYEAQMSDMPESSASLEIKERILFQADRAKETAKNCTLHESIDTALMHAATQRLMDIGILTEDGIPIVNVRGGSERGTVFFRSGAHDIHDVMDAALSGTECTDACIVLEHKGSLDYAKVIGFDDENKSHVSVTVPAWRMPILYEYGTDSLRQYVRGNPVSLDFLTAQSSLNRIHGTSFESGVPAASAARLYLELYTGRKETIPFPPTADFSADLRFSRNLCALSGTLASVTNRQDYSSADVTAACTAIRPASDFLCQSAPSFLCRHGLLAPSSRVEARAFSSALVNVLTQAAADVSSTTKRAEFLGRFRDDPERIAAFCRRAFAFSRNGNLREKVKVR